MNAFEMPARKDEPGFETILMVDDDPAIRALLQAALGSHGFKVLTAAGGQEALEMAQNYPYAIDLLLTDIKMPGMDGRDLARKLAIARPETKVLFMSGFADEIQNITGQLGAESEFLQKPFNHHMLLGRILVMLTKSKKSRHTRIARVV